MLIMIALSPQDEHTFGLLVELTTSSTIVCKIQNIKLQRIQIE